MYWGHHYWGMHLFWWIFWLALVTMLVFLAWPPAEMRRRETALDILRRRFAGGEITEDEYRHLLDVLTEDEHRDHHTDSAA